MEGQDSAGQSEITRFGSGIGQKMVSKIIEKQLPIFGSMCIIAMRYASVVYRQGKRLTVTIGCISEVGEDCFPSLILRGRD